MESSLNIAEVASELGVCTKTIRRWVKTRRLSCYVIGSRYRFKREDVEAFVQKARVEAREDTTQSDV
jgi:excisionase family DNA binding protein